MSDDALKRLSDVAAEAHEADSNMVEAAVNALEAGASAAEVARITGIPYGRVRKWRRLYA